MITFTTGNLLEAPVEALVNTVNTVGVMGKGIALMFKESFPANFKAYEAACKEGSLQVGKMLVTERSGFIGPKYIINFPTKKHWRNPSKMEWIEAGLRDLVEVIRDRQIKSVALPPLGAGNGKLDWSDVRPLIEAELSNLVDVEILVFEPTDQYQNVAKRSGVEKLTPPRALIAELVRRYSILGIECTILEVQKLGYFLERFVRRFDAGPLEFTFSANRYGPYSDKLKHMLNGLDGSYLHCNKRLADASPRDVLWFEYAKRDKVAAYLTAAEAKPYKEALEATSRLIDGFESPASMELLATVDWLIDRADVEPSVAAVKAGLRRWPGGEGSSERKVKLFDERSLGLALEALSEASLTNGRGQQRA